MRKLFKAADDHFAKRNRSVLKALLFICIGVVLLVGLIAAPILWSAYLDPQIKRDRLKLDSILADKRIDAVEILSWDGPNGEQTNRLYGNDLSNFLTTLNPTNRISNVDCTKQQQESYTLLNGTNQMGWLRRGEDGAWEFGKYGFRLRHE